jgi:outer membrane protein assembly factor BamA
VGTPSLDGLALGSNQGTYVSAEFRPMLGLDDTGPAFSQWEAEVQHFVPLRFSADGIAVRLHATGVLTGDDVIPFYLLPTLGGSNSIRGLRPARFRDHNTWVANVEYRRNLMFFADGAVFVDAGQVFDQTADLSLSATEFGYGVGLIARVGRFVLGRLDIARSREGFQVYLRAGSFL